MRKTRVVAHLFLACALALSQYFSSVVKASELSDSSSPLELTPGHQFQGLPLWQYSPLDSNSEVVNPQVDNFPLKSGSVTSDGDSSKRIWYLVLLGLLVAGLAATATVDSGSGSGSGDGVITAGGGDGVTTGGGDDGGVAGGGSDSGIAGGGTADDTRPAQQIDDRNESFALRGVFLSAGVIEIERDATAQNNALENRISQLSFGYDQLVTNSLAIGALFNSSLGDTSFENSTASTESDSNALFAFSSYRVNQSVDLSAYIGFGAEQISRSLLTENESVSGKTDAENIYLGFYGSKRYLLGSQNKSRHVNGVEFLFDVKIDYSRRMTNSYAEKSVTSAGLNYRDYSRNNLQINLGTGVSKVISKSYGVIVPKLTLGVVFDPIEPDAQTVSQIDQPENTFEIEQAPQDKNYGIVEFDTVLVRPHGLQFFTNFNSTFSNRFETNLGFNIGARKEF